MKFCMLTGCVLAALLATPAAAQETALLGDWGLEDMYPVVVETGARVKQKGVRTDGRIYLDARSANGLLFSVIGESCTGTGLSQRCKGAEFTTTFNLNEDEAVQDALRTINYAAVHYYNGGDGDLMVTRYVIFDNGITRANLRTNAEVYISIAEKIWDKVLVRSRGD